MLSIPHLIVLFLVAFIVLGPDKLPQVARVLGKTMAEFRRVTSDFRYQIEDEMRDIERQKTMQEEAEKTALVAAAPEAVQPAEPAADALAGQVPEDQHAADAHSDAALPAGEEHTAAPAPEPFHEHVAEHVAEPAAVTAPAAPSEKLDDGQSRPA